MRSRRTVLRGVKPSTRILGLDASLTSTGYAFRDEDDQVMVGRLLPGKKRGCSRLWHNVLNFAAVLDQATPDVVVIEGYAMGGKGNTYNIGEWGGIARLEAWKRGIMIVTVTPSTLKQLVTGSGAPDKNKARMIASVAARFDMDIPQDDEADAFALMAVGEAMFLSRGPTDFVKTVLKQEQMPKSGIEREPGIGQMK